MCHLTACKHQEFCETVGGDCCKYDMHRHTDWLKSYEEAIYETSFVTWNE